MSSENNECSTSFDNKKRPLSSSSCNDDNAERKKKCFSSFANDLEEQDYYGNYTYIFNL
ncbi:hypothetical protein LbFV_ORF70 [Leptopilina boulardi filamentous virus]|uniref:Uncharacterized protein n=1 Tax=Leptopilina boulardi filamentous virus TaxID=552509 RepID=A0A1S5YD09_9VIRU|nr:hypothetical protein LbFV_ORF70 [Leptopilina boulardi filamentous virus]AQQ79990.1 hypothetical protein LbFV_ORF70 [Leptopilina boulardi filamentous virus]